jgi:hypothetical protein
MLSSIVSEPLRVVVKPSRLAFYYLLLIHGVASFAVWQVGVYSLFIGLIVSLTYYLCDRHNGIEFFSVQGSSCWLKTAKGSCWHGVLGSRHFVSTFFLVVQIQRPQERGCRYLVLCRDALDNEAFRSLRVLLLLSKSAVERNSLVLK